MTSSGTNTLRLRRLAFAVFWLSPFPAAWLYYYRYETWHHTTCIYKSITGSDCAFCGLTRAFANATHAQFQEATELNVTWPFYFALFLLIAFSCLSAAISGNDRFLNSLHRLWQNHYGKILIAIVLTSILV